MYDFASAQAAIMVQIVPYIAYAFVCGVIAGLVSFAFGGDSRE